MGGRRAGGQARSGARRCPGLICRYCGSGGAVRREGGRASGRAGAGSGYGASHGLGRGLVVGERRGHRFPRVELGAAPSARRRESGGGDGGGRSGAAAGDRGPETSPSPSLFAQGPPLRAPPPSQARRPLPPQPGPGRKATAPLDSARGTGVAASAAAAAAGGAGQRFLRPAPGSARSGSEVRKLPGVGAATGPRGAPRRDRDRPPREGAAEPRPRPDPDAGGEVTFRPVLGLARTAGEGAAGPGPGTEPGPRGGGAAPPGWWAALEGESRGRHRPPARLGGGEEARGPKFAKRAALCLVF